MSPRIKHNGIDFSQGIDSVESIHGVLESLNIRALTGATAGNSLKIHETCEYKKSENSLFLFVYTIPQPACRLRNETICTASGGGEVISDSDHPALRGL
jgi:hypothetical protein